MLTQRGGHSNGALRRRIDQDLHGRVLTIHEHIEAFVDDLFGGDPLRNEWREVEICASGERDRVAVVLIDITKHTGVRDLGEVHFSLHIEVEWLSRNRNHLQVPARANRLDQIVRHRHHASAVESNVDTVARGLFSNNRVQILTEWINGAMRYTIPHRGLSTCFVGLTNDHASPVRLEHSGGYAEERGRTSTRKVDPRQRDAAQAVFRRIGRFGVSSFVSNRLPILEFPPELLDAVRTGQIEFTKAQAIARVSDVKAQRRLLADAITDDLSLSQIRRRITELRGGGSAAAVPEGEVSQETQRLVTGAKRLLNKRRLASLDGKRMQRVTELLEELQQLLADDSR